MIDMAKEKSVLSVTAGGKEMAEKKGAPEKGAGAKKKISKATPMCAMYVGWPYQ
jgi:hypothetical protein